MPFCGLRVAVVMPAYNVRAHIAEAVRTVPRWVDEIFVVDDGSSDDTTDEARRGGDGRLCVIRHEENQGVGAAIATGYVAAFDRGADVAAVMAGDGQMDPEDLSGLLEPLSRGEADYVKGDRLAHPSVWTRMPMMRLLGNHGLSWLTRLALGAPVRDSQCGYTALSRTCARTMDLRALYPRYGYPNDLCARVLAVGGRIDHAVVRPIYGSEQSGITLATALWRIPMLILRILLRTRLRRRSASPRLGMPVLSPKTHDECA